VTQCVAVRCSVLQCIAGSIAIVERFVRYCVLQCATLCCSVLPDVLKF